MCVLSEERRRSELGLAIFYLNESGALEAVRCKCICCRREAATGFCPPVQARPGVRSGRTWEVRGTATPPAQAVRTLNGGVPPPSPVHVETSAARGVRELFCSASGIARQSLVRGLVH